MKKSLFILTMCFASVTGSSYAKASNYTYSGESIFSSVNMTKNNGVKSFAMCFTSICSGCKLKHIKFTAAKRRGERIVINASVKYSVWALLGTGNYTKDWRVELYDDIDRYKCIDASY